MIDLSGVARLARPSCLMASAIVLAGRSTPAEAQVAPAGSSPITALGGQLPAGTRLGGDGRRQLGGSGSARIDTSPPPPSPATAPRAPLSTFRLLAEAIDRAADPR